MEVRADRRCSRRGGRAVPGRREQGGRQANRCDPGAGKPARQRERGRAAPAPDVGDDGGCRVGRVGGEVGDDVGGVPSADPGTVQGTGPAGQSAGSGVKRPLYFGWVGEGVSAAAPGQGRGMARSCDTGGPPQDGLDDGELSGQPEDPEPPGALAD